MSDQSVHVLIIGFVWPEPQSSAAGSRMLQLISLFQQQGWKVTFASSARATDQMADLDSLGIDQVPIEINSRSFDKFIQELNPSIVLFDRFVTEEQFGWRVAEQCSEALRILDTEDLHFLRRTRKEAVRNNRNCTKEDLLRSEDARREIASIFRSDLSLIISEVEIELLKNVFRVDAELVQHVPFLLNPSTENRKRGVPDFDERQHFVTIGNFRHPPNMDAIRYLKMDIWPLIRKEMPHTELHIYGAYPTGEAKQMHKPEEGFLIKGRAENAREVVAKGKVLLAPLRFGAGLKGKLIEAMQCGTPTVTTDIGAEGIERGAEQWGGIISNDPKLFAKGAQKLYRDKKLWQEAQQRGFDILDTKFLKPDFGQQMIAKIHQLLKNRKIHRTHNFIGQMLMHHTMNSSKYMARWIEAKNRNR